MNVELEGMWKEMIMAYFKALFWHMCGGSEENHKKSQSGKLVFRPRYEPGPPESLPNVQQKSM
jgi:hypothetical protein